MSIVTTELLAFGLEFCVLKMKNLLFRSHKSQLQTDIKFKSKRSKHNVYNDMKDRRKYMSRVKGTYFWTFAPSLTE